MVFVPVSTQFVILEEFPLKLAIKKQKSIVLINTGGTIHLYPVTIICETHFRFYEKIRTYVRRIGIVILFNNNNNFRIETTIDDNNT